MDEKQVIQTTEIHFTDEQAAEIMKVLEKEQKMKKSFFNGILKAFQTFFCSLFEAIIGIITLKNTGKWISIGTVAVVLWLFARFLHKHNYSTEAMTIVVPYLGQIAIVVFGIIGGFKGVQSIITKVSDNKKMLETLAETGKDLISKKK